MIVKNFRNKKIQTIIILLMITLSTMLINGALSIMLTVQEPIKDLVSECKLPEATIHTYNLPDQMLEDMMEKFEGIDGVEGVYRVDRYSTTEDKFLGQRKLETLSFLAEYNKDVHKNIRCIDGDLNVDAYRDDQCAIPAAVANDQDIKVGDVITIKFAAGPLDYQVAGIYADPENMSIAFSSNIYMKKLPVEEITESLVLLDLKEGTDPYKVEAAYRNAHDGKLPGQMLNEEERVSQQMMLTNILGGVLLGIGLASLLVCMMIVIFIVRNAVMSDSKKIAIYKTYGYSYSDVLEMYLIFYSIVIFVGALLGSLASLIFASIVLTGVFKDMGATITVNPLFPGFVTSLVITLVVTLFVWLVLRKTRNIKPVFALRGSVNTNTKKNVSLGAGISFSPFSIALRSILRDKKGAAGILIASIAVVFLANMGVVALDGAKRMEAENDYWLGIPSSQVIVEINNPDRFDEILSDVRSDKEVEKAEPWIIESIVNLPWKEGATITMLYAGVYEDYDAVDLEVLEGRNPKTKDEIALGSKMAEKLDLKVGDYLTASLDGENDISLLVTGIFQTYYDLGQYSRLCYSAYEERDIPIDFEKISVFLKDGVDTDLFIDRYSREYGDDVCVIHREECCKSIMTMVASPQEMAIPPVVGLILLIGGISIFSIVLLRNMKNEKTNQIYKSIGYTTRDLYVANIFYVEIIGLIATVIGLPALLFSYRKIMTLSLSVFGLREYRMVINPFSLIAVNVLILISFALSSIISSKRLKKLNVRDLVIE